MDEGNQLSLAERADIVLERFLGNSRGENDRSYVIHANLMILRDYILSLRKQLEEQS